MKKLNKIASKYANFNSLNCNFIINYWNRYFEKVYKIINSIHKLIDWDLLDPPLPE